MTSKHTRGRLAPPLAMLGALVAMDAAAQGIATQQELAPVTVIGARAALDPELPTTSASRTQEELREQNLFNPEDALRTLPSTSVRKRYIGDRNALIGGRSFTSIQAARGLVFMDGYLLSNFLGRFDAPRWNMVAPEEIERVDVLYGPFSALYPGNSIGTTVAITTRRPRRFEASARLTQAFQRYEAYGQSERFDAWQASGFVGDRLPSGLSYALGVNHQDSTSQPMQYFTVDARPDGRFATLPGPATPVSGIQYDTGPKGLPRAVLGASGGAIDHTVQDHAKLRLGYDFSATVQADGFVGLWQNDSRATNRSFLRNAAGEPVWSGRVTDGVNVFDVPAAALAPSTRRETHVHGGVTLKTRRPTGWNGSLVLSEYLIQEDAARQANTPAPVAAAGGPGSITRRDGTAWVTFEAQAVYTPSAGDWGGGRHALVLGLHHNRYRLSNRVYTAANWQGPEGALDQDVGGRTGLTAFYAQDTWRFAADWKATLGVRWEDWEATDGRQFIAGTAPLAPYAARHERAWSPKLSLAWRAAPAWQFRASVGKGVRFPTVVELFQGTKTRTAIQVNDPHLRPERSTATELSAERSRDGQQLRVSLFHEDIRDTIFSQTDTTVVPNVTNVQNVGRVRARGIELAWGADDVFVRGLKLEANATWVDARTLESRNLASIGKFWVRVPRTRANLMATYAANERWMTNLTVRHSGRQYNELDNSDIRPDVYGAVSRYTMVDLRVVFRPERQWELALGVDNLSDRRAFVYHPLPGRTLFAELRWQR